MKSILIRTTFVSCLLLLINFYAIKADALLNDWVSVPKSQFGEQLWNKSNSKFTPRCVRSCAEQGKFATQFVNL